MKNTNKFLVALATVGILSALIAGAYAAFSDQVKFQGSGFHTSSADLKILVDPSKGTEESNLVDSKPAPNYTDIYPNWSKDELLKLYNNGSQPIELTSNMDYATANDPASLRESLYMEIFPWADANGNGLVDTGELGTSYGKKGFTSWKSTGFDLGTIEAGGVKGLVLRFSAGSMSNTKQGQSAVFDYVFDSVGL